MGSFRTRRSSENRLAVAGGLLDAGGENTGTARGAAVLRADDVVERLAERRVLGIGRAGVRAVRLDTNGNVDEAGTVARADGVGEQNAVRAAPGGGHRKSGV